jgi:hypothetical protein
MASTWSFDRCPQIPPQLVPSIGEATLMLLNGDPLMSFVLTTV